MDFRAAHPVTPPHMNPFGSEAAAVAAAMASGLPGLSPIHSLLQHHHSAAAAAPFAGALYPGGMALSPAKLASNDDQQMLPAGAIPPPSPAPPTAPSMTSATTLTSTSASSAKMRSTATVQPSSTATGATAAAAAAMPPSNAVAGGAGGSSFAAALRSLAAKNAEDAAAAATAGGEKAAKKSKKSHQQNPPPPQPLQSPSAASSGVIPYGATQPVPPIGTIAPMLSGAQATLMDVRKGFDRTSSPSETRSPTPGLSELSTSARGGFQPYRPEATPAKPPPQPQPPSPSPAAAPFHHHQLSQQMNPHYIMALQAAYQTAALYGAAVPGYDHEALYRLQLERYAAATGLAIPGGPSLGAYPSQGATTEESSSNASVVSQDGAKSKPKEESKASKSKSKSGSSSSKSKSASSKHRSSTAPAPQQSAGGNPLPPLPLPMLPEFAQPFALPPFPAAVQLRPQFPAQTAQTAQTARTASAAHHQQEIRLPTKPLDISEVSRNNAAAARGAPTQTADTKSFMRPFEEAGLPENDRGGPTFSGQECDSSKRDNVVKVPPFSNRQRVVVESNNNEVAGCGDGKEKNRETGGGGGSSTSKEQFAVLRSLMTAPPMSATTTAAVAARCSAAQVQRALVRDPAGGGSPAKSCDAAADNHVFKEPVMKEKLKYLRYFRLVTHRKKNGDSSKPEGSLGQNGDSASSGEEALRIPMTSSPSSMSLSSSTSMVGGGGAADMISPPTQSLTAESSQAKVAFMGAIGLWRVPEEEKQEREEVWNVILDDRITRLAASSGGALAKLRGARKRAHDGSSSACFLYPGQTCKPIKGAQQGMQIPGGQLQIPGGGHFGDIPGRYRGGSQATQTQELLARLTPSPVLTVASSPSPTSSVLPSSPMHYATVQLPINLSTLMPVPKWEVKPHQEHALLNGLISTAAATLAPWQGVEAVAESFKAYSQGVQEERAVLQHRLQFLTQEVIANRNSVDGLSTQMANMARRQKIAQRSAADLEAAVASFEEVLSGLRDTRLFAHC